MTEASSPTTGNVYVVGESYCRVTEQIDEEIPVAFFDEWFTIRKQQIEQYGYSRWGYKVHEPKMKEEDEGAWQEIEEKLEGIEEKYRQSWEVASPMREMTTQEIDGWFQKREFAADGEESAIGVAKKRSKAGALFFRLNAEMQGFDLDDADEEENPEPIELVEESRDRKVRFKD